MGLQRALLIFLLLICLAAGSLALTACTQEQVATVPLRAVLLDPVTAHECLHGDDDRCWVWAHWNHAQYFCKPALEAAAPRPNRWEEQPLEGGWLKDLVEVVPEADLVVRAGTPSFYEAWWWSDRQQGIVEFRGAYDLQSRTGINEWTPWEYTCAYDTFRYQVVDVLVAPVPDQ